MNIVIEPIIEFLGCEPEQDGLVEPERYIEFNYKGKTLEYRISIDLDENIFAISGDLNHPFSGNSLYEVYVEYDRIGLETEPEFYGEQKQLVIRKDFKKNENMQVLMIMRWPDNELSVWPSHIKQY